MVRSMDRTNFASTGMFVLKLKCTNKFKADGLESKVVFCIARVICYRASAVLVRFLEGRMVGVDSID